MAFWNIPDVGLIKYREYARGSPEESYVARRTRAVRIFDVLEWEQRWSFVKYLMGFPTLHVAVGAGGPLPRPYIKRTTPDPYPAVNSAGDHFLFAKDVVKIEGVDPRGWDEAEEAGVYRFARITVSYETLPFHVAKDDEVLDADGLPTEATLRRYVTKIPSPAAERRTLPRGFGRTCLPLQ
jgi:hypothetical protein